MSLCHTARSARLLLAVAFLMLATILASVPAMAQADTVTPPKVDVFVGYQWLDPGGNLPVAVGEGLFTSQNIGSMPRGVGGAVAYNFTKIFALEADTGANFLSPGINIETVSVGPRFMWRTPGMNFFAHALVGWNRLNANDIDPTNKFGAILGGGMDLTVSRGFSIRLFEADYQLVRETFDSVPEEQSDIRRTTFNGIRLRGGIVMNFGGAPPIPPTATCSIQPGEVMVGEPLTATVAGGNFNPKHTLTYAWSSTGGKVTGKDTTATVDTNGVAGGSYVVTAHITDAKMKKGGEASCTANFTVKEPPKNPPTMSCSANPTSVQTGTASTISCSCTSPDGVPVTVAGWNASAGIVSGNGNTASLSTTGAPAGPITVSATCTDSRGLTAQASTQVNVEVPPPPPPMPSKLGECQFPNKAKPWRVDNTCKAVLDDVAKYMQQNPDATLVIVGNIDPAEKRKNLAGERAVNSKAYLSGGEAKQGIDAGRIGARTGGAGTTTAEFWVIPAGASYSGDAQPVDENAVQPVPDHPAKKPAKKAAAPQAQ